MAEPTDRKEATPRTDEAAWTETKRGINNVYEVQLVTASFARDLERELTGERMHWQQLHEKHIEACRELTALRERVKGMEKEKATHEAEATSLYQALREAVGSILSEYAQARIIARASRIRSDAALTAREGKP